MMNNPVKLVILNEQDKRFLNERAVLDYFVYHLQWRGGKLEVRRLKIQGSTLLYFQYKGCIIAKAKAELGKEKEIEINSESIMIRKRRIDVYDIGIGLDQQESCSENMQFYSLPHGVYDLDGRCAKNIDDMCFN